MKYVFGPVPSRRLGQSLGIDTIPLKTCNWNCIYCQLGRSVPLVNERREYVPSEDVIAEVEQTLAASPPGSIDWVTFVGSGEPTLHSGIGELIRQVRALTRLPVAVITNGALLYRPDVRDDLAAADAVLPTLDAGNPRLYRKINRPHPDVSFDRLVDGLGEFRSIYRGQMWVEVMLVRGLNDTEEALQEIAAALRAIRPDQVHINLPVRPPAEARVQPSDEAGIRRAQAIFGDIAQVVRPPTTGEQVTTGDDLAATALGIITRHPMQEKELFALLGNWSPCEVHNALDNLVAGGKAQVVDRYGARFWSAAGTHFSRENNQ
ncbi:MAG: radical SAM protein [Anaerolineae bacterium]|nr:radical SAM protein [Anaerolineae bacterium]